MTDSAIEVVFDPLDAVRLEDADELLDELRNAGLQADATCVESRGVLEGLAIVALITVAMTTVSGLCVIVAFMHKAFAAGVVVDASEARVRVRRDATLPRGSVLTIPRDGEPVMSYNISGDHEWSANGLDLTLLGRRAVVGPGIRRPTGCGAGSARSIQ